MNKFLSTHEWQMTAATYCTLARIILTPFIVIALVYHYWMTGCVLFIVAAITDALDGFLARYYNQKTLLGACLDPIADKILLVSCFFTLSFSPMPFFQIPVWFIHLICIKEFVQIFGAAILFFYKKNVVVEATILGKVTTIVHIFFIIWLFLCYFYSWTPTWTYMVFLAGASLLVVASFTDYMVIGVQQYRGRNE